MIRLTVGVFLLLVACREAEVVPDTEPATPDSGIADTAFVEFGAPDTVIMPEVPAVSFGRLAMTTASVANEQYVLSGSWDAWAGRCEDPRLVQLIAQGEGFGFALVLAPADSVPADSLLPRAADDSVSTDSVSTDSVFADSIAVDHPVADSAPGDSVASDSLPGDTTNARNRFSVSLEYRGQFEPGTVRVAMQIFHAARGFALRAHAGSIEIDELGEVVTGRMTGTFVETTFQDTLLAALAFSGVPVRPVGADSCRVVEHRRPN